MRKRLTILLCLLVAVGMLAACATQAAPTTAPTKAAEETAPAEESKAPEATGEAPAELEPVTINVLMQEFVNAPINMEQVTFKTLGEKLNFKFNFEQVPGADYNDKLNVILSGGQLPDYFYAPTTTMAKYYSMGVVRVLDELLQAKGQNILAEIEGHGLEKNVKADDGHYYFLPTIDESAALECSGYLNNEWMTACGITDIPKTTDDLYTVLKTFKEKMPNDSVPMVQGPWYNIRMSIYRSFKAIPDWVMYKESEGYLYGPVDTAENLKLALAYMHKLYAEGLMDKEYMDRDTESCLALIANNQVGYFHTWTDGASLWCKGGTDGRDYVIIAPLKGSNGECWTGVKGSIGNTFYISAQCEDKIAERAVMAIDYMFSAEGKLLFDFGAEGDTYTMVDGKPVLTDKVMKHEVGALNGRRTMGMEPVTFTHFASWDGWASVLWPQTVTAVEEGRPYNMPQQPVLSGTEAEETELANIMTDINTYVNTSLDRFIVGEMDVEKDFDAFVQKIKEMGIDRAKEIQNAKFERWKAR